jgi:hypothetical protein
VRDYPEHRDPDFAEKMAEVCFVGLDYALQDAGFPSVGGHTKRPASKVDLAINAQFEGVMRFDGGTGLDPSHHWVWQLSCTVAASAALVAVLLAR